MTKPILHDVPLAIGEYIVIETKATHPDELEQKTASGIILKTEKPDFNQAIPRHGTVVSKGSLVPDSEIQVGDIIIFPTGGQCHNIEDPRILNGEQLQKYEKRQFCYVHWKNIGGKFIPTNK